MRKEIGRPEVRWHDLRHTHGTLLGKTTDNARIIQKSLGHTHLETTLRYVHTDHAQVREAVETIPPLSDRKLVVLRPEARNGQTTSIDRQQRHLASEKTGNPANRAKRG